jgi:CBS domain-containing protein
MKISEVMTRGVECAHLGDSIAAAAARMRELDVGSLPVCGAGDKLVGIITDRDITVRATADARDPRATHVEDAMTPGIAYAFEDADIAEAARVMRDRQIRRLPVLSHDQRLVGIVSLGDLAVETHDTALCGGTLEAVSEGVRPG